MIARHKDTGEIVELAEEGIISRDGRRFCWYQVELIPEPIDECEPSLPSNLDEAAEEYADYNSRRWHEDGDVYYDYSKIMDAFKAGAEWMTEQGETLEGEVMKDINNKLVVSAKGLSGTETKFGDKVIVQIRKKEE